MPILHIDPGFRSLLPALSPEELQLLERNLSTDGCREPLVVWESGEHDGPIILDGHNRYEICTRLGIPFAILEAEDCPDREAAITWIVANQLGRRNLTPSQKGPLGLELEKQLAAEAKKRQAHGQTAPGKTLPERFPEASDKGEARDQAAAMLGINAHYISDVKKIAQDAPEILDLVKHGKLSIPQAKKVAALPGEERPAALARLHRKEPVAEGGYIYRDGELVAVHTNKEVEVWLHRSYQVLNAIKALATVEVSPEEYLREFPPASTAAVDAQITAASAWLDKFTRCWEART